MSTEQQYRVLPISDVDIDEYFKVMEQNTGEKLSKKEATILWETARRFKKEYKVEYYQDDDDPSGSHANYKIKITKLSNGEVLNTSVGLPYMGKHRLDFEGVAGAISFAATDPSNYWDDDDNEELKKVQEQREKTYSMFDDTDYYMLFEMEF